MVAATTAACVRRKKYARRRQSVIESRGASHKKPLDPIRREFRSIARVNPRPPGRRRRRVRPRPIARARTRRNDTKYFVSTRPPGLARVRARRRRRPVVVPEPAISRPRSIDRRPGRVVRATSRPSSVFDARIRLVVARTFLTFSRDATALVWTVFFATVVLETTRTPVKEEVAKDMTMLLDFVDVCEDAPVPTTRSVLGPA